MARKTTDSTIEEIHQYRREVSDRFGGDVFAIAQDAARRQAASNRPVWQPTATNTATPPTGELGGAGDKSASVAAG